LGVDSGWSIKRGRGDRRGGVAAGRDPLVSGGWWHALFDICAIVEAAVWAYLAFAEREEIALALAQDFGVREIARRLGRAASTVSRELRRNAATRSCGLEYRASTAQWHAERSARRPKRAKLAINAALRAYVQDRLAGQVVAQDGAAVCGPMGAVEGTPAWAATEAAMGYGVEP
jgi:hypothetical protein